jgi:DnaK suppressor protein
MDAATLQTYRTMLMELRATLEAELEQSRATAAPVALDGSMGRISRGDAMQAQQVALEVRRRRDQRLVRTQSALQRVEKGSYGRCGRCRGAIGGERLDAFPDVVLCVRCASTPKR